jgi:hypothetical protein
MCGNVRYEVEGDSEASVRAEVQRFLAVANCSGRFSAIATTAARLVEAPTPATPSTPKTSSRSPRAPLKSTRRRRLVVMRSLPSSGTQHQRYSYFNPSDSI